MFTLKSLYQTSNFVHLKKIKLTMNLHFLSKISLYSVHECTWQYQKKSVLIYVRGSLPNSYRLIYTYLERILIYISWGFHSLYNIFHKIPFLLCKSLFLPLFVNCESSFAIVFTLNLL